MQKQRDEALRQPLEPIAVRPELSVELGRKDEALEDRTFWMLFTSISVGKPMKNLRKTYENP